MDKNIIKTITKSKSGDIEDVTKTFFTNCILKNKSVETFFYTTVKNPRGECKKQQKA